MGPLSEGNKTEVSIQSRFDPNDKMLPSQLLIVQIAICAQSCFVNGLLSQHGSRTTELHAFAGHVTSPVVRSRELKDLLRYFNGVRGQRKGQGHFDLAHCFGINTF